MFLECIFAHLSVLREAIKAGRATQIMKAMYMYDNVPLLPSPPREMGRVNTMIAAHAASTTYL